MSRSRLIFHSRLGTPTPTPGLSPTYDTRFGTATDASGWITFDLHSGNRRVWLDSSRADDTGDGLSAATAKKSFDAAMAVFWGGGWTSGDQLMIAGGSAGGTYTDNKTGNWSAINGINLTYPTVAMSYDRSDPTNTAKYGKLLGSLMPSITLAGVASSFEISTANGYAANYFFLQGLEFIGLNTGISPSIQWLFKHTGVGAQNCRFYRTSLSLDNAGDAGGLTTTVNVSKCSFTGTWSTGGNCQGAYLGGINGAYVQDNTFIHCGWKIGALGTDSYTVGGPSQFSHGHYYHASNTNGRIDRNFYVDTAHDGANIRGSAAATCLATLDDSLPGTVGWFSGGVAEAPLGVTITVDDWLIMGGADHGIAGDGNGPLNTNTLSGSHLNNIAMFDNPLKSGANSTFFTGRFDDAHQVPQYMLLQNLHAYNYAGELEGGTASPNINDTWTNCLVDSLSLPQTNTVLNNTVVHSGAVTYPNAKTRDQIVTQLVTAIGLTPAGSYTLRKAQLVNLAAWRPELPWAQMLIDIGLPSLNLTPQYQSATIPSLASETPRAVY